MTPGNRLERLIQGAGVGWRYQRNINVVNCAGTAPSGRLLLRSHDDLRFVVGDFLRGRDDFRSDGPQVVFRYGFFGTARETQRSRAEKCKNQVRTSTLGEKPIGRVKMREVRDTVSVSKKNGA